jgi:general nucleoside transport system permease protein
MNQLLIDIAAVVAMSAPMLLATMGILLSERAGVINLSVDGSLLLAGMAGFAVAFVSGNVALGFVAAASVGALVAAVVAYLGVTLKMSQTAIGFVLALLCTDLSSFLGNPFVQKQGPAVSAWPIPGLADLPIVGPILFRHDIVIYFSLILVPVIAYVLYKTRAGLILRGVGERPEALYARGIDVTNVRYLAVIVGGVLIGLAGAAYTLDLKQGWTYRHVAGTGWIALAIVIFGAWRPWRILMGSYLFAVLQTASTRLQDNDWGVPTQVLQVAPFVVMILVLAMVNSIASPRFQSWIVDLPRPVQRFFRFISSPAPASLGK